MLKPLPIRRFSGVHMQLFKLSLKKYALKFGRK